MLCKVKCRNLLFAIIFMQILMSCGNPDSSLKSGGKHHANKAENVNSINLDSLDFYCRIERIYSGEGQCFKSCIILLTDSVSIFRTQNHWSSPPFYQVTLSKPVSDYLKLQLKDIYSQHKSIVKKQYINCVRYGTYHISKWNISIKIGEKKINESVDVLEFRISFEDPFHPQYYKIEDLVYAITKKIESDIYNFKNTQNYTPEPWIEEMFHDKYYEPYNDINSNKY